MTTNIEIAMLLHQQAKILLQNNDILSEDC